MKNWFLAISLLLLFAFFIIISLCAFGVYMYGMGNIVVAIIAWVSAGVTTYFWTHALINFIEFIASKKDD